MEESTAVLFVALFVDTNTVGDLSEGTWSALLR